MFCFEDAYDVIADVLQVSLAHRSKISSSFPFTAIWCMMNQSRFSIELTKILLSKVWLARRLVARYISRTIQSPHSRRLMLVFSNSRFET